jgi:hypothetical protein
MLTCSNSGTIPIEYRGAADALFPCRSAGSGHPSPDAAKGPGKEAIIAYAELLGIGGHFSRILDMSREELERFLASFQNNMDLMIQKTWVEKADEDRKEKLQNRIPVLISLIKQNQYTKALEEFSVCLEELAWLLFGAQSRKEDFSEYAFRIDTQMGLFWWYGSQIGRFLAGEPKEEEILRGVLFLGLCYLTDF